MIYNLRWIRDGINWDRKGSEVKLRVEIECHLYHFDAAQARRFSTYSL
jgi:hypothetical protein